MPVFRGHKRCIRKSTVSVPRNAESPLPLMFRLQTQDLNRTRREQTRSALLLATPLNHKGGQKPWFGLTARRRPAHEGDICAPTIGNTGGRPHERTKTEPVSRTRQPNLSAEPDSPNPTARTRQPEPDNPTARTRQPDRPRLSGS